MKETIKINLAQLLFDLDADAYTKLKDYLDSLKHYFEQSSEEASEILSDIEQRIAEILSEKLKDKKQVVTIADVDSVIEMMGTAEDFARESDASEEDTSASQEKQKATSSDEYSKVHRRFYRDVDNNILGGICSGLAAYFNVDSVWIRLAFIVLLFINVDLSKIRPKVAIAYQIIISICRSRSNIISLAISGKSQSRTAILLLQFS